MSVKGGLGRDNVLSLRSNVRKHYPLDSAYLHIAGVIFGLIGLVIVIAIVIAIAWCLWINMVSVIIMLSLHL